MANTQGYFGFSEVYGGSGGAPTMAQTERRIASTNSTAIFYGDPVQPVTSTANGYITQGTGSTTVCAGIFVGCKYLSTSQKRTVWSRYWPGSDATGDVLAYVIDDPNAQFLVQTAGSSFAITGTVTNFTSSPVGQYANYTIGTGNTANGQSGAYLSAVGTTITYPFIVRDMWISNSNGGDPTSANCNVIVGFNNEVWRTNGAGPTGIS